MIPAIIIIALQWMPPEPITASPYTAPIEVIETSDDPDHEWTQEDSQ